MGYSPWGCKESDMTEQLSLQLFVWCPLKLGASWVAQTVKKPPANAGDPGQEDPMEKGMAPHSSIIAWTIPARVAGYNPWGLRESDTTKRLTLYFYFLLGNWDDAERTHLAVEGGHLPSPGDGPHTYSFKDHRDKHPMSHFSGWAPTLMPAFSHPGRTDLDRHRDWGILVHLHHHSA